ncbi:hypothetical protein TTRE_0000467601 [Trichuris trichiura]|uniref:Uncharacterized protein n=1 Tax=Trichuris trichiura TaxID=36087 RepID=A0A077Z9Q3_TRITR|nr:hypothetical protein TTRE_0000467601 [Trichuris trichiura]
MREIADTHKSTPFAERETKMATIYNINIEKKDLPARGGNFCTSLCFVTSKRDEFVWRSFLTMEVEDPPNEADPFSPSCEDSLMGTCGYFILLANLSLATTVSRVLQKCPNPLL